MTLCAPSFWKTHKSTSYVGRCCVKRIFRYHSLFMAVFESRAVSKPCLLDEKQPYTWIKSSCFTVGTTQDKWFSRCPKTLEEGLIKENNFVLVFCCPVCVVIAIFQSVFDVFLGWKWLLSCKTCTETKLACHFVPGQKKKSVFWSKLLKSISFCQIIKMIHLHNNLKTVTYKHKYWNQQFEPWLWRPFILVLICNKCCSLCSCRWTISFTERVTRCSCS